jgi:2,4-didehydro-3-deoxy-L-rhamnonate hydrolase
MKLLRYGPVGRERPGLVDSLGKIRDLSAHVADIDASAISPAGLARLANIDPVSLPELSRPVRLGVPVTGTRKFVAIGVNFADHAIEANLPIPVEPIVFLKAPSCLSGPNDAVMLPKGAVKGDWEVELGVVIGGTARHVDEADALSRVAGYCVVNDVSERDYQFNRGGTWDKGKGCDTFGPVGPWLVTADEIPNPQELDMWLNLNGRRMQTGNTRTMIFGVAALISYVSRFMTLEPGDILTTGTPPGVGMGIKPEPIFLSVGDTMQLGIEGLGEQKQTVIGWERNRSEMAEELR